MHLMAKLQYKDMIEYSNNVKINRKDIITVSLEVVKFSSLFSISINV